MRNNYRHYFEQIYDECDEAVICIDKGMRVIYTTEQARCVFADLGAIGSHISCMLPMRYCNHIRDILDDPHCISFDFRSISGGRLFKCTVTPVFLSDGNYFALNFCESAEQLRFIGHAAKAVESELVDSTVDIISSLRDICHDRSVEQHSITKRVLRLRKMYHSFSAVVTDEDGNERLPTAALDLNKYIERFITVASRYIDRRRACFRFDTCSNDAVSDISYEELDIVCCNAVAQLLRRHSGYTQITLATGRTDLGCMIVISDNDSDLRSMHECDMSHHDDNEFGAEQISYALMCRLIERYSGKLCFFESLEGGMTVVITLPPSAAEVELLCQPEECDTDSIFSIFSIMLSDIDL